ncbi:MAG TPA: acetyl-CoA carboxylase biotin carboxylase subunit [Candidatus Kapabacteria bacterium]|nr:acetyl-CoA carboxylase biotin carboxylase subunit [Candidatus Kapabacteria bacterium]HOV91478.1 acetyl-CoA carboxylase biotin carboxylase subunit [Candidatus Kapabacteria bacterium]
MIKKVLVANRGEIAVRIIHALKEMDIKSVAIYSDVDKNAVHTQLADESIRIGPPPPLESYLNQEAIINAALETGCDAIHPGYGFLSERYDFNQKVRDAGLIFIGANPNSMRLLGSKVQSRQIMAEAGIPIIPGMMTSTKDYQEFEDYAKKIGFPIIIKSSDGGGGKGMRIVREMKDLHSAIDTAIRESISAFGSDAIYLEKYIENPRHIEFQVARDHFGNAIHLNERECSIQRRHQKIIEETPSPVMTAELRKRMGAAAIQVVNSANYDNIGTVEFLVDKDLNFYFLEVNARVQVEHPITELTTGIDLVKLQINIADNQPIPYKQEDVQQNGHAIECRIYAEDADNNFAPSPGKILYIKEPSGPGIRYDSGIDIGSEVPTFYDPILSKLIVWGSTRDEAIKRMVNALKQTVILGVKTPINFMINVLNHTEFKAGNINTNFLSEYFSEKIETYQDDLQIALAAASFSENYINYYNNISQFSKISNPWLEIGKWELF